MTIKIGDSIRLEPLDGSARQYQSKVLDIGDGAVHIGYPVDQTNGKTVYLLNGMQFKASVVGQDGGLYLFDTEVKGKVRVPLPMIVLSYPGEEALLRVQRRRYVRVKTNVDAAVHPLNGEFAPFATMTVDLSAGGAALVVPPAVAPLLHPRMPVELWLVLPMRSGEYHYVQTKAAVVRTVTNGQHTAKTSVEFTELDPQDRLRLIRYSFERQLEERKKE